MRFTTPPSDTKPDSFAGDTPLETINPHDSDTGSTTSELDVEPQWNHQHFLILRRYLRSSGLCAMATTEEQTRPSSDQEPVPFSSNVTRPMTENTPDISQNGSIGPEAENARYSVPGQWPESSPVPSHQPVGSQFDPFSSAKETYTRCEAGSEEEPSVFSTATQIDDTPPIFRDLPPNVRATNFLTGRSEKLFLQRELLLSGISLKDCRVFGDSDILVDGDTKQSIIGCTFFGKVRITFTSDTAGVLVVQNAGNGEGYLKVKVGTSYPTFFGGDIVQNTKGITLTDAAPPSSSNPNITISGSGTSQGNDVRVSKTGSITSTTTGSVSKYNTGYIGRGGPGRAAIAHRTGGITGTGDIIGCNTGVILRGQGGSGKDGMRNDWTGKDMSVASAGPQSDPCRSAENKHAGVKAYSEEAHSVYSAATRETKEAPPTCRKFPNDRSFDVLKGDGIRFILKPEMVISEMDMFLCELVGDSDIIVQGEGTHTIMECRFFGKVRIHFLSDKAEVRVWSNMGDLSVRVGNEDSYVDARDGPIAHNFFKGSTSPPADSNPNFTIPGDARASGGRAFNTGSIVSDGSVEEHYNTGYMGRSGGASRPVAYNTGSIAIGEGSQATAYKTGSITVRKRLNNPNPNFTIPGTARTTHGCAIDTGSITANGPVSDCNTGYIGPGEPDCPAIAYNTGDIFINGHAKDLNTGVIIRGQKDSGKDGIGKDWMGKD